MKNLLFLFFCCISLAYASEKQTDLDILRHFASNADYAEIFRYCTYFIKDPKPHVIQDAFQLMQTQDPSLYTLIKKAWQKNGNLICTAEEESRKKLQDASIGAHTKADIQTNLTVIQNFKAWLEKK